MEGRDDRSLTKDLDTLKEIPEDGDVVEGRQEESKGYENVEPEMGEEM